MKFERLTGYNLRTFLEITCHKIFYHKIFSIKIATHVLCISFSIFFSQHSLAGSVLDKYIGEYGLVDQKIMTIPESSEVEKVNCGNLYIVNTAESCSGVAVLGLSGLDGNEVLFCQPNAGEVQSSIYRDDEKSRPMLFKQYAQVVSTVTDVEVEKKWTVSTKIAGLIGSKNILGRLNILQDGSKLTVTVSRQGLLSQPEFGVVSYKTTTLCHYEKLKSL